MEFQGNGTRKLSFTVQLSDTKDYKGGDLVFHYKSQPVKAYREKGMVVVFPSTMLHEVTPVKKGTRYSLVGWVAGPRFR
jgi:PKHD-type hydroxylase